VRFLITGGAGFIGSHLAERLVARGERVHGPFWVAHLVQAEKPGTVRT